jgi:hypothetical protein
MTGLPSVRIDDVMVHPRDNDLILGTHGRSIWIIDDITALQQLSDDLTKTDEQVLDIRPATAWTNDIQRAILAEGAKHFRGQNPPRGAAISYWLKSAPSADVRITITDITGREIRSLEGTKEAGLNRVQWDLTLAGGRGGRGAGRGGGGAPAAPETPAPGAAAVAPAGQAPAGQQAAQAAQPQRGAGGGGGGGGRGGFAPPVAPGSYLVKVIIGDRVIGQKTLVVEADTLQ